MKKITIASLTATAFAVPAVSMALTSAQETGLTGSQAVGKLQQIIDTIGTWALLLLGTLAAFYIILAAFDFLTAQGDATKIKGARTAITYALVALVVGAIAKLITSIVGGIASGI